MTVRCPSALRAGLSIYPRAFIRPGCRVNYSHQLQAITFSRPFSFPMSPPSQRRLNQILNELSPTPPPVGTLTLGDITYEVPASLSPSRLSHSGELLDLRDPVNIDNLHFILQKYLLGQDIFLVSQPGPYARHLALTFSR